MLVKFNASLTQTQYDALASKDSGTLYFTTDTRRLYKGDFLYSEDVVVSSALPGAGQTNRVYVVNDGTTVLSYIWNGTAFKPISSTPSGEVVTDVSFDDTTQTFTFTRANGQTVVVDLVLETVFKTITYNSTTKILTLTTVSGATTTVSLTDLVDAYSGGTTNSTTVTVASNGTITCDVKVSPDAGNQVQIKANGLFVPAVDISGKMDKVPTATNGNVASYGASGQVVDSGKSFVTAITTSNTDAQLPTAKAVMDALTWA